MIKYHNTDFLNRVHGVQNEEKNYVWPALQYTWARVTTRLNGSVCAHVVGTRSPSKEAAPFTCLQS